MNYQDIVDGKLETCNEIDSELYGKYKVWYFSPRQWGKQDICVNNVFHPFVISSVWHNYFQIQSAWADGFVRKENSGFSRNLIAVNKVSAILENRDGTMATSKSCVYYVPVHEEYVLPKIEVPDEYSDSFKYKASNLLSTLNAFYKSRKEIEEAVGFVKNRLYSYMEVEI